jgi:short-subunit dehydrogenase
MLLYNAGADSVIRDFHDRDLADAERMIALNISGPMRLSHHFGAIMRMRKRGGIIIVGSLAAYAGNARTAMYSGAKALNVFLRKLFGTSFAFITCTCSR